MRINILEKELKDQYDFYLKDKEFDLFKMENILCELIRKDENNTEYVLNYALVLLCEPILDYEKAFDILSSYKNDIRAFFISCYINDWFFKSENIITDIEFDKWLKVLHSSKYRSSIYYFHSKSTDDLEKKKSLLEKSLQEYQYNFFSIVSLQKLNIEYQSKSNEIIDYFNKCIEFMQRVNKLRFIDKKLFYKAFYYYRILGLTNRDSENINALRQIYFTTNQSDIQIR